MMSKSLKERIAEGATELFLQRGIKAVRMDDLASELGVSKRTIYEQFENREALISECAERFVVRQERKALALDQRGCNVIDDFLLRLENWERTILVNVNFMNELKVTYPRVFDWLRQGMEQRGDAHLKARLQQGIEHGIFLEGLNLDFTVIVLRTSISTIFTTPSIYEGVNVSMFEAFKYITMCFFRGIATEKGIQLIDQTLHKHFPKGLFATEPR